jgi:Ca2+/Na+ antiporter
MKKSQINILVAISIVAIVTIFFIKPIPQSQEYHLFADRLTFFSIPNFWNVISNLPFLIIGGFGIVSVLNSQKINLLKLSFIWFFLGIILTGFGSAYYHYNPNDETLVWDRLPMTISFMSFLSIIISEFINIEFGEKVLYPFLIIGISSIVYWIYLKDLRPYVLIQFLPISMIPIILFLSKNNLKLKKYFWMILVAYIIAKFLESYDLFIYTTTYKIISGHTLKHFAAAIAPFIFYKFVKEKFQ